MSELVQSVQINQIKNINLIGLFLIPDALVHSMPLCFA